MGAKAIFEGTAENFPKRMKDPTYRFKSEKSRGRQTKGNPLYGKTTEA